MIDTADVTKYVSVIRNSSMDSEVFQFELQLPVSSLRAYIYNVIVLHVQCHACMQTLRPVCWMNISAVSRRDETVYSFVRMGVGFTDTIVISTNSSDPNSLPFDDILSATIKLFYNFSELNTSVTTLCTDLSEHACIIIIIIIVKL